MVAWIVRSLVLMIATRWISSWFAKRDDEDPRANQKRKPVFEFRRRRAYAKPSSNQP